MNNKAITNLFLGCLLLILTPSCSTDGKKMESNDIVQSNESEPECDSDRAFRRKFVSIHDAHTLDTAAYQKFQHFDFCKLQGSGKIEREPYVLVRDSADFKIIWLSNDLYNPYRFQNMGDYWYSYRSIYMDIPRHDLTLSSLWPSDVMRFVQNDTLYEYWAEYLEDKTYPEIKVHTDENHAWVYQISWLSGNGGKEEHFTPDLLTQIKDFYKKHKSDTRPLNKGDQIYSLRYHETGDSLYENDLPITWSPIGCFDEYNTQPRSEINNHGKVLYSCSYY